MNFKNLELCLKQKFSNETEGPKSIFRALYVHLVVLSLPGGVTIICSSLTTLFTGAPVSLQTASDSKLALFKWFWDDLSKGQWLIS